MRKAAACTIIAVALVLGGLAVLPVPAVADEVPCDPDPIGRCGEHQRESVVFCYVIEDGEYVSATDENVVVLGGESMVAEDTDEKGLYYVQKGPAERFLGDVITAPLPGAVLFEEGNNVAGLQPTDFECGTFVWFAECVPQQWMGPYNVIDKPADAQVV